MVFVSTSYYISSLILLLLVFVQVHDLVQYVERTNSKLSRLIAAIDNEDFSQQFYDNRKGDSFRELVQVLNGVIRKFSESRQQKEEALYYLQTVLDHSPVAIVVFDKQEQVEFINKAGLRLTGIRTATHLRDLQSFSGELVSILQEIGHEQTLQLRLIKDARLQNLSIRASKFGLYGKILTLVSLQNIHHELEEKELESWQKLMNVLTHEIMNSVTPITSLADTTAKMVATQEFEEKSTVSRALDTIRNRGEGLLQFTQAYRSVTRLPAPVMETFSAAPFFSSLALLFSKELQQKNIQIRLSVNENATILADPKLMEQVFVNLLLNAMEALENTADPLIEMSCVQQEGHFILSVRDNGVGISPENTDRVFVPFFTTKKNGSGIGLSISRQLLRLQGGHMEIDSAIGKGTTIRLLL